MVPAKLAPALISLIISGLMSLMVSGFATFKALGLVAGFFGIWMSAWFPAWAIAFPALFILRPIVTKLVMDNVRGSSGS